MVEQIVTGLEFGQPAGAVMQFGYWVADIEAAMRDYIERLRIGPWFVTGPFIPRKGVYRGQPTQMSLTLAMAFTGNMMLELIEQHDSSPSVYNERAARRGHGFHHWGVMTHEFDAEIGRYRSAGCEVVFSDVSPRGTRIVYIDTTDRLPGMVELIEHTSSIEAAYARMQKAAVAWDGSDPIRRAS